MARRVLEAGMIGPRMIPGLEYYRSSCPYRPRKWNVTPSIDSGACTRAAFPGWRKDQHRAAALYHGAEAARLKDQIRKLNRDANTHENACNLHYYYPRRWQKG